jgi:predicted CXXCH cytochrome family protein
MTRHPGPLTVLLLLLTGAPVIAQTAPPAATPATAVGTETCVTCHDGMATQFSRSAHGRLDGFQLAGQSTGCESCHGPGSRHVDSGSADDIVAFDRLDADSASGPCLTCHRRDAAQDWMGSQHAGTEVGCTSCHAIHQSRQVISPEIQRASEGSAALHATAPAAKGSLKKAQTDLCLDCHQEQRARLLMPSRHPVREGRMECSSCHDPHGAVPGQAMLRTTERPNDLCYTCHASKQGPWVFEHEPVEESCATCHDPHGTVANNLLKQGEPFLCLQCHEMHFHSARIAPMTPVANPSGFPVTNASPTAFMEGYNTRCSACHVKIHGSDLPSQGVSGRGKALTR